METLVIMMAVSLVAGTSTGWFTDNVHFLSCITKSQ